MINYWNWFIYYYLISGIITFFVFWYLLNKPSDKQEVENLIADISWNTGIKRASVKNALYAIGLVFGFIILPYEIGSDLLEFVRDFARRLNHDD